MKRHKYVLTFAIVAGVGFQFQNHSLNAQEVVNKEIDLLEPCLTFEQFNVSQSQTLKEVVEAAPETIKISAKKQLKITQTLPETPKETESEIEITVTDKLLNQPLYAPFRREGTLRNSTRPAYVINREQIEAQGAKTAQEALKSLPGILSDGTAGGQLGAISSQFIRGSNSAQVLILLDGRPISDVVFFGGFDLSELTTDAIERIEVVPGGGSTLYGSDAIGGVINIITRIPTAKPEVSLSSSAGSFGLNQQGIQARGRSGKLGWVIGYNRTESKDFGIAGGVPIPIQGSVGKFNSLTPKARQYTEELVTELEWKSKLGEGHNSLLTAKVFADFLDYNSNTPDPANFGTKDNVDRTSLGTQIQHSWQITSNQNITYGFDYRNTNS